MRARTVALFAGGTVFLAGAAVALAAYAFDPYADWRGLRTSIVRLARCAGDRTTCRREVPDGYTDLGDFRPTFYRILDERAAEWPLEEPTESLLSRDGRLIARVAPTFQHRLDIEGSARLRDGRIVNLDERIEGRWRYLVARDAPYGLGASGYKLIPYRTLAVDPKVIRRGTVLYLPALDGVRLPTGEIHDGFAFAHDVGERITGRRVDIFVGFESDVDNALIRSARVGNMVPLRLYRVDRDTASELNERFRPQFEAS